MKNFKPFFLGCIAGCGVMFVALQYHLVQSHDGLQFVPRTPKSTLGLAYADVRQWQAEQWADFPELARALIAHGASDLIAASVASNITDSVNPDAGTIGQLRSLLNDQAPLFEAEDSENILIPFPNEAHNFSHEQSSTHSTKRARSRTDVADSLMSRPGGADSGFHSRFADFEDASDQDTSYRARINSFMEEDTSQNFDSRQDRSSRTKAAARVRDTTILEDLLFSEVDESNDVSESIPSLGESRLKAITRALDSRASRALDRAGSGFSDSSTNSTGAHNQAVSGDIRDRIRSEARMSANDPDSMRDTVPHAVQALRDGFDPFLD